MGAAAPFNFGQWLDLQKKKVHTGKTETGGPFKKKYLYYEHLP